MKLIKTYLILLLAFFLVGFYFVKDDDSVIGVFNDDYFKSPHNQKYVQYQQAYHNTNSIDY